MRSHRCTFVDYRSLRPIEIILDSSRFVADTTIDATFQSLQSIPAQVTDNEKDVSEYHIVSLQLVRYYLQQQHNDSEAMFLSATKAVLACFASANAALHKSLSIYLISYYASLASVVRVCPYGHPQSVSMSTAHQVVQLYLDTLQFKYQHAWTYILPALSAMTKFLGYLYPQLFRPLLQQLVAIFDSSDRGDASYARATRFICRFEVILTKTLGYCMEAVGVEEFMKSLDMVVHELQCVEPRIP